MWEPSRGERSGPFPAVCCRERRAGVTREYKRRNDASRRVGGRRRSFLMPGVDAGGVR